MICAVVWHDADEIAWIVSHLPRPLPLPCPSYSETAGSSAKRGASLGNPEVSPVPATLALRSNNSKQQTGGDCPPHSPLSWLHADHQLDTLTTRVQVEEQRVTNKIPAVISCQMKSTDFKAVCCCRCLPRRSAFNAAALGRQDHDDMYAECRVVLWMLNGKKNQKTNTPPGICMLCTANEQKLSKASNANAKLGIVSVTSATSHLDYESKALCQILF